MAGLVFAIWRQMARLCVSRPLWLDRTPARSVTRYSPLRTSATADVVIVGGGMTGVSIAWRFARAGVRVALLEASRVGRGSTAASTALLMQEPDEDLRKLAQRFGATAATRIWKLGRKAVRDFVRTLQTLDIDCDLVRCDSVYFTTNPAHVRRLRSEFRRHRATSEVSQTPFCAGLWRQWHDVRLSGGFASARLVPRRARARPQTLRLRAVTE